MVLERAVSLQKEHVAASGARGAAGGNHAQGPCTLAPHAGLVVSVFGHASAAAQASGRKRVQSSAQCTANDSALAGERTVLQNESNCPRVLVVAQHQKSLVDACVKWDTF